MHVAEGNLTRLSIPCITMELTWMFVQQHDHAIRRRRASKTNFVEVRTFLHLFRSFDRMWAFFILSFQV